MRTICVYMNEQCVNIRHRPSRMYVYRDNDGGAQLRVTTKNRKYLKTKLNAARASAFIHSIITFRQIDWEKYVQLDETGKYQKCHVHDCAGQSDFPIESKFVQNKRNVQTEQGGQ